MGSIPIDKSRVLDVKPLRCLAPVFPNSPGNNMPSGPFPPGVQPFYPFLAPNGTQQQQTPPPAARPTHPVTFDFGSGTAIPAPIPLNSFRAASTPQKTPITSRSKKAFKNPAPRSTTLEDDMDSDNYVSDGNGSSSRKRSSGRPLRRSKKANSNGVELDTNSLVESLVMSFKLNEIEEFRKSNGDKDTVQTVLLVFDLLRRKLSQLDKFNSRSDLTASKLCMTKGIRTNSSKRVGSVPGIEVGHIFFFRMEMCIAGAHAPSMAGIDYMTVKIDVEEEPIAVSIVSSGGYHDDDDVGDGDVLIYSGQGGIQRDGQISDQKLERGNLALEKSLHRGNGVRVIRGVKDIYFGSTGKIYIYDGLYKVQESWSENKSGCNVFKYKLGRLPGQPDGFSLWKSIQRWKEGTAVRPGLILADLALGAESGGPVALVNDVDGEKGPTHFTYVSTLKYSKPFSSTATAFSGCQCVKGCDTNCTCNDRNDGFLPYSSLGVLLTEKSLIYECGSTCACQSNCKSRLTQAGLRFQLEIFKINDDRGWGVRSWDPIRSGGFICEYAGEPFISTEFFSSGSESNYIFDATRHYEAVGGGNGKPATSPLVISAEKKGNVARFMNHSCSPNVFWRPVLRGNNNEHVHIAFFAIRHIPPMQELTFDYGVPTERRDKGKKRCFCGSGKCKGYFYDFNA